MTDFLKMLLIPVSILVLTFLYLWIGELTGRPRF
jgi:hypothetical protein